MTRKSRQRLERQTEQRKQPKPERMTALIEVYENTFVYAVWFIQLESCDVLGWMYRRGSERWNMGYRFRYYADEKAFNSADRKSVWRIDPKEENLTEEQLAKAANSIDTALDALCHFEHMQGKSAEWKRLDIRKTGARAMDEIRCQPWSHEKIAIDMTGKDPVRGKA